MTKISSKIEKLMKAALAGEIDTTIKDNIDAMKAQTVVTQDAGTARRPTREELQAYFKAVYFKKLQIKFLQAIL